MNKKLTRNDLWSLEEYSDQRTTFRQKILSHKQNRQISLGNHLRLCFEDMLTIKYQIQEMLRIEKIFDGYLSKLCEVFTLLTICYRIIKILLCN